MAKKRNSVDVIAASAPTPFGSDHYSESVSCRKIDNGYVVTRTECRNGEYKSTECFEKEPPNLERAPRTNVGRESLREAKEYLSK